MRIQDSSHATSDEVGPFAATRQRDERQINADTEYGQWVTEITGVWRVGGAPGASSSTGSIWKQGESGRSSSHTEDFTGTTIACNGQSRGRDFNHQEQSHPRNHCTSGNDVIMQISDYSRCFGLCEMYAEVVSNSRGWGVDRIDNGAVITAGRFQWTVEPTTLGKRVATWSLVCVAVRAVSTVCGASFGFPAEPLELVTWLVMVRKFTA